MRVPSGGNELKALVRSVIQWVASQFLERVRVLGFGGGYVTPAGNSMMSPHEALSRIPWMSCQVAFGGTEMVWPGEGVADMAVKKKGLGKVGRHTLLPKFRTP